MRGYQRREEGGAAAVEFALVVPLLLAIVFGVVAYGFVFAQALSLGNSARQSARSGVIDGTTCTQINSLAQDAADTIGMDGADAVVVVKRGASKGSAAVVCGGGGTTKPCAGQVTGTNLYVAMTYTTQQVVPLIPIPSTITGSGVFRCEFS